MTQLMLPARDLAVPTTSTTGLSRRTFIGAGIGAGSLVLVSALAGCGRPDSAPAAATDGPPRTGGNLRVGVLGGGNTDSIDVHTVNSNVGGLRVLALADGLVRLKPDASGVENVLAESIEVSADARVWTIRLKPGLLFSDGSPIRAQDVLATFRRIADPTNPLVGATNIAPLDLANATVLDPRTLRIPTLSPFASFLDQIAAAHNFGIVPEGYLPGKSATSGPFTVESFTPGGRSVFTRNQHYWQEGRPYLDQLTIVNIDDDTAAFNALQSDQIDAYADAAAQLAGQVRPGSGLTVLESLPALWKPFTMRVDQKPFDDVRVRQAFRLLVDREALVGQAFSGYAEVGNDVFSWLDADADATPIRERDVDQAKFLLRQAGHDDLSVELTTAPATAGLVEQSQVFAQQARDAGVTVNIRQITPDEFYGPKYLSWTFATDYWAYSPYLSQAALSTLPSSPTNETHFADPEYTSLYEQANATVDARKRAEIIGDMRRIDFDRGGNIIASRNKILDIHSDKVRGFTSSASGFPMGGATWADAWLAG